LRIGKRNRAKIGINCRRYPLVLAAPSSGAGELHARPSAPSLRASSPRRVDWPLPPTETRKADISDHRSTGMTFAGSGTVSGSNLTGSYSGSSPESKCDTGEVKRVGFAPSGSSLRRSACLGCGQSR
jgi:hypothetical protein